MIYLHFYKIKFNKNTNKSLLTLSRVGLILINFALLFKYGSAFMPHIHGIPVPTVAMNLISGPPYNNIYNNYGGESGDCYCRTYWSLSLVTYVAAFYLLKLIYHKRVIIMLQNPLFGNDRGIKSIPISMAGLLIGQILAFSLCEFLVINYVTSHCTDESQTNYDKNITPFGCHDTFESIDTWIAVLAIVFDALLFSLFCSKWYKIMLIFMEEMATSLLVQFSLVIMAMVSCTIDACAHMILLYANTNNKDTFDSFLGTPSFCLDCTIIALCLVLSFTDSQKYIMKQIGITDLKPYYQSLENLGYALHIM